MNGLTRTLPEELGRINISANTVLVKITNTPMVQSIRRPLVDESIKAIPLARIAEPKEQASVICFLASVEASFVKGAALNVSGGSCQALKQ